MGAKIYVRNSLDSLIRQYESDLSSAFLHSSTDEATHRVISLWEALSPMRKSRYGDGAAKSVPQFRSISTP